MHRWSARAPTADNLSLCYAARADSKRIDEIVSCDMIFCKDDMLAMAARERFDRYYGVRALNMLITNEDRLRSGPFLQGRISIDNRRDRAGWVAS